MIHHDFMTTLLISLREGHDAILPTESLNAAGVVVIALMMTVIDASSTTAGTASHETAIFGISCVAALGEAVAVVVESLTGVGAHGNGG